MAEADITLAAATGGAAVPTYADVLAHPLVDVAVDGREWGDPIVVSLKPGHTFSMVLSGQFPTPAAALSALACATAAPASPPPSGAALPTVEEMAEALFYAAAWTDHACVWAEIARDRTTATQGIVRHFREMAGRVLARLAQPGAAWPDVDLDYTNHRGERSTRTIRPTGRLVTDEIYHPGVPFLVEALDVARGVVRTFDPKHMHRWGDVLLDLWAPQAEVGAARADGGAVREAARAYLAVIDEYVPGIECSTHFAEIDAHKARVSAARLDLRAALAAPGAEGPAGETFASISQWCEETFGPIAPERIVSRAAEEMDELRAEPTKVEEAADVVIVLSRYPGLWDAVQRKMAVNRGRTWRLMGDGTGYHVKAAQLGAAAREGGAVCRDFRQTDDGTTPRSEDGHGRG